MRETTPADAGASRQLRWRIAKGDCLPAFPDGVKSLMIYSELRHKKESLGIIWGDYWEKVREKMCLKWQETQ